MRAPARAVILASVAVAGLMIAAALHARPVALPRAAHTQSPGEGVWRNYDFVPGHTVWKATDFTQEPVGRFPAGQIEFVRGNLQIVELDGERVLEATADSVFRVLLPRDLPEAFSLEFRVRVPTQNIGVRVFLSPPTGAISRYEWDYVDISAGPGIYRKGTDVSSIRAPGIVETTVPVALQVDDSYAILYVGPERAAQVPTANFPRASAIEFHLSANARFPTYLSDIVVAVGLDKLYDALVATGEFTTRGILFDSGSDELLPESTPVLEQILSTLAEHPEIGIVIEGHTDAVGEDAFNQDLSQRRASAVVRYLVAHGVQAERLEAVGKGETEPAADNATAEGRRQNRRVVIRLADSSEG